MKNYTDFIGGMFYHPTYREESMRYIDWNKVKEIVEEHPTATIYAGLREDWNNTSGMIFSNGKYYNGYVYGSSYWATPIVDVDGEEIECYVEEKPENFTTRLPDWWGTEFPPEES